MFCKNCGTELNAGTSFCTVCGSAAVGAGVNVAQNPYDVEIKGNFPIIQSKIPLALAAGEQLILQNKVAIVSGMVAGGLLSLTNKRILVKRDGVGKTTLTKGLLGTAMTSGVTVIPEIRLSNIVSIRAARVRGAKSGAEITTRDGYTHRYVFQNPKLFGKEHLRRRDFFVSVIQNAISGMN